MQKLRDVFIRIMFVMMLFITLSGCDRPTSESPYKIIDSGMWSHAESASRGKTWWIDNERVIFPSNKRLEPGGGPPQITTWNTSTGQVSFSQPWDTVYCVRDGQVFYALRDKATNKVNYYRGPLDNASEYPFPGGEMREDDCFDCGWVPKATSGLSFISLPHQYKLRGENYLEFLERKTETSIGRMVYHERPGDKGEEMPFYLGPYRISYSEFLDAYIVDKGEFASNDAEASSFWILNRDGSLKEEPFPESVFRGNLTLYPLREGYLVHYNSGKYSATDPGNRGLYLLKGEKFERLVVGSIHGISVSPDGCKVAFIYAQHSKEYFSQNKPYRTVRIINFCPGGSKQ